MSHTQGIWKAQVFPAFSSGGHIYGASVYCKEQVICDVIMRLKPEDETGWQADDVEKTVANAELIASAPAMLSELTRLREENAKLREEIEHLKQSRTVNNFNAGAQGVIQGDRMTVVLDFKDL